MKQRVIDEIKRLQGRTHPEPSYVAMELAMKWAFREAAAIAAQAGSPDIVAKILDQLKFDKA